MLIDSHMHLTHGKYNKSANDILKDAEKAGVGACVNIGTSLEENEKVLMSLRSYANIFGTVGIYPHENRSMNIKVMAERLEIQLKSHKKIVAVGECGIDITDWKDARPVNEQKELFIMQAEMACRYRVPLVVHNRNGNDCILETLGRYIKQGLSGVAHCFSQDWDYAKKMLDMGFYLSFAGNITYPSNKNLRETLCKVPEDRFLLETDSPNLPPQGHRGEVNYPEYVRITAEMVAETRQEPFEKICEYTYNNTCRLFSLKI